MMNNEGESLLNNRMELIMNQQKTNTSDELENCMFSSLQEDIPEPEIQRFRSMFDKTWDSRNPVTRFLSKPLHALMLLIVILTTLFGTGYAFVSTMDKQTESNRFSPPRLMQGQRVIEHPELVKLFPDVENPTVISSDNDNVLSKPSVLIHGYLAEHQVQVVWEY